MKCFTVVCVVDMNQESVEKKAQTRQLATNAHNVNKSV